MVKYVCLDGFEVSREWEYSEESAVGSIGRRVSVGFPAVSRFVTDRQGDRFPLVYFTDALDYGHVWAIYEWSNQDV